jgi:hypothetical protein
MPVLYRRECTEQRPASERLVAAAGAQSRDGRRRRCGGKGNKLWRPRRNSCAPFAAETEAEIIRGS